MKLYEFTYFEERKRVKDNVKSKVLLLPIVFFSWVGVVIFSVIYLLWLLSVGFIGSLISLLLEKDTDLIISVFEQSIECFVTPFHFWYRYIIYGEYGMYDND